MGTVIDATGDDVEELISHGLVLVDVWGPRCQPCLALAPHVERIAVERPTLRVVKVDASRARRWCIERRVMGLPTFLLFRDGREVGRLSAPDLGAEALEGWLEERLGTEEGS